MIILRRVDRGAIYLCTKEGHIINGVSGQSEETARTMLALWLSEQARRIESGETKIDESGPAAPA